jgi:hypothetical protein
MIPITELTLETAPPALWREWLAAYFNGAAHDVGGHVGVLFPRADLAFGQGEPAQPLDHAANPGKPVQASAEIRVICLPRTSARTWNSAATEGEHLLATDTVMFQFQVRASQARRANGQYLAANIAQLLYALLGNPDTRLPLARNGITHLQPNKPMVIESKEWAFRLLNCPAQLQFPIRLGGAPASAAIVTTMAWQSLPYFREQPLLVDEYVPGSYELPFALTLTTAHLTAWPGAAETVLELEVAGVLSGHTITIPAGDPLAEVTASATLNLPVAAQQALRWKIVSGPADIADAAWHLALVLQTTPP